jgi:DNA recombination protein RmuC
MKDEFQRNRVESSLLSKNQREELSKSLDGFKEGFETNTKRLNDLLKDRFDAFSKQQTEINQESEKRIKEVKETVENQLKEIREDNTKQLNEVRKTVDEKLQKTLNERLTQSFESVGKQLKSVQEGLGEMKNLATDVGGLKKVLSNVKMRGGIGEVQLAMLLEQILAPDQYEANVKTKKGSSSTVEFAIKLPGKNEDESVVWLPVDAKFPKDVYEKLQEAYEDGDLEKIQFAQKELDNTIKKMAKDISEKYIDPPNTTDFGIMFLPFEGIYAEVVRKASLLETLQRDYKIIVTGPTTLAAILNSLQMGFKTLAIQKRSSEVWHVLGAVKKEFENFGGMMSKAQNNIRTGLNQLDDVMGVRTRAIQRKLKDVTSLNEIDTTKVFPELKEGVIDFDDEDQKDLY